MTVLGADPDQLDALAAFFESTAAKLDGQAGQVTRGLTAVYWRGGRADNFRHEWQRTLSPGIRTTIDDLREQARLLRENSTQQREVSEASSGPVSGFGQLRSPSADDVYAVATSGYSISTEIGAAFVGQDNTSSVDVTEMSDGTYRIAIDSDLLTSLGISLEDLVKSNKIGYLGVEAGIGTGFQVEVFAQTAEDAAAVESALKARVSSATNRFTGGGVDSYEIFGQEVFSRPGVHVSSLTRRHMATDVSWGAQIGPAGFSVGESGWNETTYNADGSTVHRSVSNEAENGTGWDQGGSSATHRVEVREQDGSVTDVVLEVETTTTVDTRSGWEKARDLLPVIENEESTTSTSIKRYTFSPSAIESVPGASDALAQGDRTELNRLLVGHSDLAATEEEYYSGARDGSERGETLFGAGYSSSTEYSSSRLTARSQREAD